MNTRPIRFFHRGQIVQLEGAAPTRHVLDWLREERRLTGTKEGCAEGDCGACTVVLGRLDASGALRLEPVNACLLLLPMLDGRALFSVEDLASADGALHPVQQALVDCHGSQCGFCTPGFVMSLWASYEGHLACGTRPSRQQLADELSGNLCRCTGYRPILDAGQRLFDAPPQPLPEATAAAVVAALRALQDEPSLALDHQGPTGRTRWWAPRSLAELAALAQAQPTARLIAGNTDIGLWINKQLRQLPELISLGRVAELQCIDTSEGELRIGAAVSLEEGWAALVARWPALREMALRFASLPIRRAGTLGGNVANGSPIGDAAPVLMALGAHIVLQQGSRVREMPLADFYLDYMKNRLEPGEFVQALRVPMATDGAWQLRAWKLSKRFDCDISALAAALALRLEGDRVAEARFVYGGMAAVVRHARQAEAAVLGQPWTEATVRQAMQALAQDFKPLSDLRASADYRLQAAQNLLLRLWHETRPDAPLAPAATRVWHRAEEALP